MTDAIDVTQSDEDLRTLKDSFAHFGKPGYAFIPHKDPFWRQVFQRFRVVILILLGTASFFALLQIYLLHREGSPDVRRLLKMTQIAVTEDCENINYVRDDVFFDGERVQKCILSLQLDASQDADLALVLAEFNQYFDGYRFIDFEKDPTWSNYLNLANYLRKLEYSILKDYDYDYNTFDRSNFNEVMGSFNYWSEEELAFLKVYLYWMLRAEPLPKYIETPYIQIKPDFWILNSKDQITARYEIINLFNDNSRIAFILFYSFLFAGFPIGVLFFITSILVNRLLNKAPQVFFHLTQGNYMLPKNNYENKPSTAITGQGRYSIRPASWQTFAQDLENAVTASPWRTVLFLALTIIIYTIMILTAVQGNAFEEEYLLYTLSMVIFFLVPPPFLGYIIAQYIWVIYVIAQYIVWLPQYFDLRVDPDYEDRSGGLGPLGELFILMGSIIIPFALVAIVFIVSDFFLIFQLQGILIAIIFILAFTFILVFLVFLRPMLSIRRAMENYKTAVIHEGRRLMRPLRDGLRLLAREGNLDSEEALTLREKLYSLETIYAPAEHLPTLPFSSRSIVVYIGAQLFPLVTITVTLIQLWQLISP